METPKNRTTRNYYCSLFFVGVTNHMSIHESHDFKAKELLNQRFHLTGSLGMNSRWFHKVGWRRMIDERMRKRSIGR